MTEPRPNTIRGKILAALRDAPHGLNHAALAAAVWGDDPPGNVANNTKVHVCHLRAAGWPIALIDGWHKGRSRYRLEETQ